MVKKADNVIKNQDKSVIRREVGNLGIIYLKEINTSMKHTSGTSQRFTEPSPTQNQKKAKTIKKR